MGASSSSQPGTAGDRRIYPTTESTQTIATLLSVVIAVVGVGFSAFLVLGTPPRPESRLFVIGLAVVTAAVFLGIAFYIWRAFKGVRLELSPEGVRYHAIMFRLFAPWHAVRAIERRTIGAQTGDALILTRWSAESGERLLQVGGLLAWMRFASPSPEALGTTIPLWTFSEVRPGAALVEDLRRHIPKVVEEWERRQSQG